MEKLWRGSGWNESWKYKHYKNYTVIDSSKRIILVWSIRSAPFIMKYYINVTTCSLSFECCSSEVLFYCHFLKWISELRKMLCTLNPANQKIFLQNPKYLSLLWISLTFFDFIFFITQSLIKISFSLHSFAYVNYLTNVFMSI